MSQELEALEARISKLERNLLITRQNAAEAISLSYLSIEALMLLQTQMIQSGYLIDQFIAGFELEEIQEKKEQAAELASKLVEIIMENEDENLRR
jgi:hypothetical protein